MSAFFTRGSELHSWVNSRTTALPLLLLLLLLLLTSRRGRKKGSVRWRTMVDLKWWSSVPG